MKLGIGSYTYVWEVGVPGHPPPRPLTADGLLDKAVELGVRVVQIADNMPLHEMAPDQRRQLLRRAQSMSILLEAGTRGFHPDHLRTYLRIAAELQSPILRVVIDDAVWKPTEGDATAVLREVAPEFEHAGVTLAIENHDRFPSAALAQIVESVGSSVIGICLDTANSLGCGEGLEQVLGTLKQYVVNLHIKDFVVRRHPHAKGFVVEGCPAGKGLVNIPALLATLAGAGRDCNAIVELWPAPEHTIEASIRKEQEWAASSVRYVRGWIQE
jgi:sugar phosphate isomerase/epimerase